VSNMIDRLRELDDAATVAPWRVENGVYDSSEDKSLWTQSGKWKGSMLADLLMPDNAELIALMRNSLPQILALVDALENSPWEEYASSQPIAKALEALRGKDDR